jgi:hypothetical protein
MLSDMTAREKLHLLFRLYEEVDKWDNGNVKTPRTHRGPLPKSHRQKVRRGSEKGDSKG